MQRRPEHREKRRREKRGPPPEQPASGPPQQRRRPEHENQRQHPGRSQPPEAIGQRAHRRVDHRRPGEIRRERRHRPAMQPVRPLQMPGPQVLGLILERRIGPDQPQRQQRLNHKHRHQQQARGNPPPRKPPQPRRRHRSRGSGVLHRPVQSGLRRVPSSRWPVCRDSKVAPACDQGPVRRRLKPPQPTQRTDGNTNRVQSSPQDRNIA